MPRTKHTIRAYLRGHPSYEMIMSALSEMGMVSICNSMIHSDTTKSGALKFQRPNEQFREMYFQAEQREVDELPRNLVMLQMEAWDEEEAEASIAVVSGIASYFGGHLDLRKAGSGMERVEQSRSIPAGPVSNLVQLLGSDELAAVRAILSDPIKAAAVAEAIEHVWPQTHRAAPHLN